MIVKFDRKNSNSLNIIQVVLLNLAMLSSKCNNCVLETLYCI